MSKISQLGPILADETASNDLFVMVNRAQGDDGTKNITRSELVKALQKDPFTNINITGGNIANVTMSNSTINTSTLQSPAINSPSITGGTINNATFNTGTINNSALNQPLFGNLNEYSSPLDNDDEFILRDAQSGSTVTIKFSDLNLEISEKM